MVKIMMQKTHVNWAKITSKWEPKSARKGSGVRTNANQKRCWNWVPFKSFKKSEKSVQGVILSRKGAKDRSTGGGLSGAAAPKGRSQVHARVKRKKGTAERKKNQERKSKACGKRYKGIWTRQWPEAWRILVFLYVFPLFGVLCWGHYSYGHAGD